MSDLLVLLGWLMLALSMAALHVHLRRRQKVWALKRWLRHRGMKRLSIERIGREPFVGEYVRYRIVCHDPTGRERSGVACVGTIMDWIAFWRRPTVRVQWEGSEPVGAPMEKRRRLALDALLVVLFCVLVVFFVMWRFRH